MTKPTTMLATTVLLLGSLTQSVAETKLLWRTLTSGLTLPTPEGAGFSGYVCGNPLR